MIHVSIPDEHGFCSLGVEVGLTKTAAESAKVIIAEVNEQMPRTLGDAFIHVRRLDAIVPVNYPIAEMAMGDDNPSPEIERMAAYIAELIPDVRDRLEVVVVATPHTVERYTSNPNGAVFGYSMTTTGHTIFRPRADTPVPGLYLAGAWTFFGSGYIPALLSGTGTAQMIQDKK